MKRYTHAVRTWVW